MKRVIIKVLILQLALATLCQSQNKTSKHAIEIAMLDFLYTTESKSFKRIEEKIVYPWLVDFYKSTNEVRVKTITTGYVNSISFSGELVAASKLSFDLAIWGHVSEIQQSNNYDLSLILFFNSSKYIQPEYFYHYKFEIRNNKVLRVNDRKCNLPEDTIAAIPGLLSYKIICNLYNYKSKTLCLADTLSLNDLVEVPWYITEQNFEEFEPQINKNREKIVEEALIEFQMGQNIRVPFSDRSFGLAIKKKILYDLKETKGLIPKGRSLIDHIKASLFGYGESWAVIIGIDDYDEKKGFQNLQYAVNDAIAMKDCLTDHLGFSKNKIIILQDHHATKSKIERLLVDELPNEIHNNDNLFVFFSGHGYYNENQQNYYLVPADGQISYPFSTCLSPNTILDMIKRSPAKHVLYIIDACYSGFVGIISKGANPVLSNTSNTQEYVRALMKNRGVWAMTAGTTVEKAYILPEFQQSLYTYYLTIGLRDGKADINKDGYVPLYELQSYLQVEVGQVNKVKQTPQLKLIDGEGQFVFEPRR